jgi:hypothetical protein
MALISALLESDKLHVVTGSIMVVVITCQYLRHTYVFYLSSRASFSTWLILVALLASLCSSLYCFCQSKLKTRWRSQALPRLDCDELRPMVGRARRLKNARWLGCRRRNFPEVAYA